MSLYFILGGVVLASLRVCVNADLQDSLYQNNDTAADIREARFGIPISYGTNIQGLGGGTYTPVKIELGGIFLGTVIGLGAVLLIPKLAHLFSSPSYGGGGGSGYFRNLPDSQYLLDGLSKAMARFEETLGEQHIDSVSCLEKVACSYARSVTKKSDTPLQNGMSPLIKFAIEGTKLKAALDQGADGGDCSLIYPQCNFNKHLLMSSIRSAIMDNKLR